MPVLGSVVDEGLICSRWKHVTVLRILGHLVSHCGSIDNCFQTTIRSAWRAFWGNIGRPSFSRLSFSLKMRRLKSLIFPIINFRLTRWPYTHSRGAQLDRIQRQMVGICLNLRKVSDETFEVLSRRKNARISLVIEQKTRWSYVWCTRIVVWHAHVITNTAAACLSARIHDVRSTSELEQRRSENHNRPACRCFAGFSSVRWYDCVGICERHIAPP